MAPEVIDDILDSHLQRKSDQTFIEKSLDIDTGYLFWLSKFITLLCDLYKLWIQKAKIIILKFVIITLNTVKVFYIANRTKK